MSTRKPLLEVAPTALATSAYVTMNFDLRLLPSQLTSTG